MANQLNIRSLNYNLFQKVTPAASATFTGDALTYIQQNPTMTVGPSTTVPGHDNSQLMVALEVIAYSQKDSVAGAPVNVGPFQNIPDSPWVVLTSTDQVRAALNYDTYDPETVARMNAGVLYNNGAIVARYSAVSYLNTLTNQIVIVNLGADDHEKLMLGIQEVIDPSNTANAPLLIAGDAYLTATQEAANSEKLGSNIPTGIVGDSLGTPNVIRDVAHISSGGTVFDLIDAAATGPFIPTDVQMVDTGFGLNFSPKSISFIYGSSDLVQQNSPVSSSNYGTNYEFGEITENTTFDNNIALGPMYNHGSSAALELIIHGVETGQSIIFDTTTGQFATGTQPSGTTSVIAEELGTLGQQIQNLAGEIPSVFGPGELQGGSLNLTDPATASSLQDLSFLAGVLPQVGAAQATLFGTVEAPVNPDLVFAPVSIPQSDGSTLSVGAAATTVGEVVVTASHYSPTGVMQSQQEWTSNPVVSGPISTSFTAVDPSIGLTTTLTSSDDGANWNGLQVIGATAGPILFNLGGAFNAAFSNTGPGATASPNPDPLAGLGQALGSQIGELIGGKNPLAQLAGGTLLGALGSLLQKNVGADFATTLQNLGNVTAQQFGEQLGGSFASVGSGLISSQLTNDLLGAIGVSGFGGQLAAVVLNTAITGAVNFELNTIIQSHPPGRQFRLGAGRKPGQLLRRPARPAHRRGDHPGRRHSGFARQHHRLVPRQFPDSDPVHRRVHRLLHRRHHRHPVRGSFRAQGAADSHRDGGRDFATTASRLSAGRHDGRQWRQSRIRHPDRHHGRTDAQRHHPHRGGRQGDRGQCDLADADLWDQRKPDLCDLQWRAEQRHHGQPGRR